MPRHKHPLIAAAVAALLLSAHGAGLAQSQSDAEKALVEQGQYWQSRNIERATEAWEKLLLVSPGHPQALASLGELAIRAKKLDAAKAYLVRLSKAHPDSQAALQLEQDISFASDHAVAELDQARILLREQKFDAAIAKYRSLFNHRLPQGKVALEYYTVLGYSAAGWEDAIAGLERLRRIAPGDPHIQLELANLRTLRQKTRLEGLRGLVVLSRRADVGGDATEHLRSALAWMGAPPPASLVPFFQEYLKANPDDTEIRAQLTTKPKPGAAGSSTVRLDPFSAHISAGFAALDAADIARAETEFQSALKLKARSDSALGGMGLVRLRQEKFAAARELLAEASRQGGADRWKQSLDSASYWDLVAQASAARSAGRLDDARQKLEQAVQIDPQEPTAENALGGVFSELKQTADAERVYRSVLARQPDSLDALRGLVGALAAAGRSAEALKMIDGLNPEQQARIDVRKLRAEQSLAEYRAALAEGDAALARAKLEAAISLSPDDAWTRLDLARMYLKAGSGADARGVMDALLQRRPEDPEVLYPNALLLAELKDWDGASALMERIPAASRTPPMRALYTRAGVNAQVDAAVALARAGRAQEARAPLAQAEARLDASADADLLGLVVQSYMDIGDTPRARVLLRSAMSGNGGSLAVRLQYADLLLRTGQDAELAGLLRELQRENLAPPDRAHYDSIRRIHVSRQVETLRKQGDLASAYDLLAPLLAQAPDDPALLSALARLHADAGQPQEAARLYRQVLARNPDDAGALMAAGILATARRDYAYAEQALLRARQLQPQNPDVVAALGRLYRVQGKNGEAVALLRQALGMVRAQEAPAAQAPTAPATPADNNPFAYLRRGGAAPAPVVSPPPAARPAAPNLPESNVSRPAW
ncbi:tetratricopeptide repeat protein [Xylophilus sp. GW821-FHT01B05]